jgi:hypothetical protein
MMPQRIQLKRVKGWRMPPNCVKVDRTTKWGNPFKVGNPGISTPEDAVRQFREVFTAATMEYVLSFELDELRGKDLACWCKIGAPCHADVLLELANQEPLDPK